MPNRDELQSRHDKPRKTGRGQTTNTVDNPAPLPLGLNPEIWLQIVDVLRIPHFSHTKKLNLSLQHKMPMIYNDVFGPVIQCQSLFVNYTGESPLERKMWLPTHRCGKCFEEDMRIDTRQDCLQCSYCGETTINPVNEQYVMKCRKQHIKRKFSDNFYKRVVHFRYWLRRLQGKERNKVTADVINKVRDLLINENKTAIHYWNIRNALRTLKLQKYYDNCVYIMSELRGKPLVNLSRNQENVLIEMFMSLKEAFSSLHQVRINMLSYPYLIKKLCEIKGWYNMARVIPTLKSHCRIVMQDELWRRICVYKGYRFIPTPQWTSLGSRPRRQIEEIKASQVRNGLLQTLINEACKTSLHI